MNAKVPKSPVADNPADTGFIERRWTRDGQSYVYRFDLVTLKRGNLATEVMYFKRQQLQKPPKSFNETLQSGGGDYLNRCFAFLVTELDERGLPAKFDERLTYDRTLTFVDSMSMSEAEDVEACINDFFGHKKLSQLAAEITSRVNPLESLKLIVESGLMNQMPQMRSVIESMLMGYSSDALSTSPTNSSGDSGQPQPEDS
jgi:hypothetical protein